MRCASQTTIGHYVPVLTISFVVLTLEQLQFGVSICKNLLNLNQPILGNSYYYHSLPLCVVDSVYSISIRYQTVLGIVNRFAHHAKIKLHRPYGSEFTIKSEQYTTTSFNYDYGALTPDEMAKDIFVGRQRTSSKNGILKAEAVLKWMNLLEKHGIETFQDLDSAHQSYQDSIIQGKSTVGDRLLSFENDIKKIPGQKSGISLGYFYMLSGSMDRVKPDRMVMRFLERCFPGPRLTPKDALAIIRSLVIELNDNHNTSNLTLRELDHAMWKFERNQSQTRRATHLN